jgi:hypothetical protein
MRVLTVVAALLGVSQGFSPAFVRQTKLPVSFGLQTKDSFSDARRPGVALPKTALSVVNVDVSEMYFPAALFVGAIAGGIYDSVKKSEDKDGDTAVKATATVVAEPAKEVAVKEKAVAEEAKEVAEEPAPAPEPVKKDISQLKLEVGSTIEQRKEMTDRLEKAKAKEAEESQVEKEAEEPPAEEEKPKRTLLRKIWRVVKKVVAPWRKWENIR